MEHHLAWKPDVVAGSTLTIALALYVAGLARLFRRGGLRHVARLEIASFLAGWIVMAAALLSPLATLSEWLFSAHMTQHELLMLVAAPLVAIGRPLVPMLWALPDPVRRQFTTVTATGASAVITSPAFVFVLHAVALWAWHLPLLYEAAVLDDRVHIIQHICFRSEEHTSELQSLAYLVCR